MLQQMRTFAKSWVASAFLLVVVGSFALWGVADVFRGRSDTDVVSMSSGPVPYEVFIRDYRNVLRNESQRAGHEITTDEARKAGMGNLVLDQMINRAALDKLTNDLRLTVSDADVADRARQIDAFKGPLGTFDKPTFLRILQERGYSEGEFVESMRSDMARAQLVTPVQSGFGLPPGYAHALFAYSTELRATEYVVLSTQTLPALPAPSDQVLAAYIKARPQRFSTPEYRAVSFASLTVEDASVGIAISDDQLRKEYELRKSVYVVPERRDVQQITFPDEARAKAARAKIDSGTSFEMAAAAAGQTVDERPAVSQDDLGPLGPPVFALAENAVSAPLKNFSSWVLMRVTKITPGKSTSFEDAKAELTKTLTEQIAQGKLVDVANLYQDAISEGDTIAEAAKKAGMHLGHVAAVDAQGLAPDGSRAALPVDPELLAHIFAAEVGEPGDPFTTTGGRTYGIAVEGVRPPKLKSLEVARADATRVWTKEQDFLRLRARAAELARQAQRDGNLAGVARSVGAPVLSGPAMARGQVQSAFSAPLVEKIFASPPTAVVVGPGGIGGGFVVARVSGVFHPPLLPTDRRYQAGVQQLSGQAAQDVVASLAKDERSKLHVSVNQKLVNQAVGGEGL